jgi:molybdate transport system permease protein
LWLSLRVATVATLLAAAAGLGIAARLARRRGTRAEFAAACVDLPLLLPPTVVGIALLYVVGPRGPIGRLLDAGGVQLVFAWGGAVLASAVMALPLMVRTARAALESVPPRYAQAAATLGASRRRIFWSIDVPLARRGLLAALLLCFFRCLGEFGATLIVAGNIPGQTRTLPLAIYSAVFEGRPHEAWVWVACIVLVSLGGAWMAQRWTTQP